MMETEQTKLIPALEVHNLTASYKNRPVLWDVDFSLPQGTITGIIGPNGAVKTTLLKAIMGLIPTNSGYVKMFGSPLKKVRDRISYVPQRETVDWDFPASVFDVVLMGRYHRGKLWGPIGLQNKEIAWRALEQAGIKELADRQIGQLSGGQRQRVFIARALARQADLFIMDEPFAGVDAASETAILALLKELKEAGKTIVIVHHDLHTAGTFFDWIVLLNTRLISAGPKEKTFTAKNLGEAYGSQLTIFSEVTRMIMEEAHPVREKSLEDRA